MNADDREHQAEQWLDSALRHYSDVQPRPGLEQRILANLQVRQPAGRRWWRWAWVPAAAVLIISAVLLWTSSRPAPVVVQAPPTPPQRTEHAGLNPQIIPAPSTTKATAKATPEYRIELVVSEIARGERLNPRTYTLTARERQQVSIKPAPGFRVHVSPRASGGSVVLAGNVTTTSPSPFHAMLQPGTQGRLAQVEDPTTKKLYQVAATVIRIK